MEDGNFLVLPRLETVNMLHVCEFLTSEHTSPISPLDFAPFVSPNLTPLLPPSLKMGALFGAWIWDTSGVKPALKYSLGITVMILVMLEREPRTFPHRSPFTADDLGITWGFHSDKEPYSLGFSTLSIES
jgi:hypothetical protein